MLRFSIFIFVCLAASEPSWGASAPDSLTQADAQKLAAQVHEAASDQSLRSSTTIAMQALIKFGDSDIPGAVSSAYKAYGKFKDSENLDRLRKFGLLDKAALGSAETLNLSQEEVAFLGSVTSFRRLNPSFLTSSEDAKIAEEFEAKTGIKRQDFLKMLASAAENKLYVSDPKLAEKIDAEFEGFVERIPDPQFREKVKNGMALVPTLSRHKLLVEAVQKMVQLAKDFQSGTSGAIQSQLALAPVGPDVSRKPAAAELVAEVPEKDAGSSGPDSKAAKDTDEAVFGFNSDAMARASDGAHGDQKLDGVILDTVRFDAEKETIFQIVSRRYRILSPNFVRRAETKEK